MGTLLAGVVLQKFGYSGVYILMAVLVFFIVIQAVRFVMESTAARVDQSVN